MKILLFFTLLALAGLFLFKRYYRGAPGNFKGWLGRLAAVLAIVGWLYLLLKIR